MLLLARMYIQNQFVALVIGEFEIFVVETVYPDYWGVSFLFLKQLVVYVNDQYCHPHHFLMPY